MLFIFLLAWLHEGQCHPGRHPLFHPPHFAKVFLARVRVAAGHESHEALARNCFAPENRRHQRRVSTTRPTSKTENYGLYGVHFLPGGHYQNQIFVAKFKFQTRRTRRNFVARAARSALVHLTNSVGNHVRLVAKWPHQ